MSRHFQLAVDFVAEHNEPVAAGGFAQAGKLTESIHAKEDEIAALKAQTANGASEPEPDFESIVNATEEDGTGL